MLRRDFLAGAVSTPIIAGISEKPSLAKALKELECALQLEAGIAKMEVHYDPTSPLPLFIAAYATPLV
jgi:hypothetical protein